MKGKYYGVYNTKREDECVGVFESHEEISEFFGGIRLNRIACAIIRKNPLTFKKERYWVQVFVEPTKNEIRKLMRKRFGLWMYKIVEDEGIYTRRDYQDEWRFFAKDFEEAVRLCG